MHPDEDGQIHVLHVFRQRFESSRTETTTFTNLSARFETRKVPVQDQHKRLTSETDPSKKNGVSESNI